MTGSARRRGSGGLAICSVRRRRNPRGGQASGRAPSWFCRLRSAAIGSLVRWRSASGHVDKARRASRGFWAGSIGRSRQSPRAEHASPRARSGTKHSVCLSTGEGAARHLNLSHRRVALLFASCSRTGRHHRGGWRRPADPCQRRDRPGRDRRFARRLRPGHGLWVFLAVRSKRGAVHRERRAAELLPEIPAARLRDGRRKGAKDQKVPETDAFEHGAPPRAEARRGLAPFGATRHKIDVGSAPTRSCRCRRAAR